MDQEAEKFYKKALEARKSLEPELTRIEILKAIAKEDRPEFQFLLAWAYLGLHEPECASKSLRSVISAKQADTSFKVEEAELTYLIGELKHQKQQAALRQRYQESATKSFELAQASYLEGNANETLRLIESADSQSAIGWIGRKRTDFLFLWAWSAFHTGDLEKAYDRLPKGFDVIESERAKVEDLQQQMHLLQAQVNGKRIESKRLLEEKKLQAFLELFLGRSLEQLPEPIKTSARLLKDVSLVSYKSSKVGGVPDVPEGFVWPHTEENKPLAFLCQLDLSELKLKLPLPEAGMLYFFVDHSVKVTYSPQSPLTQAKIPKFGSRCPIFKEQKLSIIEEQTVPDLYTLKKLGLELPRYLQKVYEQSLNAYYGDNPVHRLCGYPQTFADILPDILDEIGSNVTADREWLLLLQLDKGYVTRQWDTSEGRLFFLIEKNDLEETRFDNVIMLIQEEW